MATFTCPSILAAHAAHAEHSVTLQQLRTVAHRAVACTCVQHQAHSYRVLKRRVVTHNTTCLGARTHAWARIRSTGCGLRTRGHAATLHLNPAARTRKTRVGEPTDTQRLQERVPHGWVQPDDAELEQCAADPAAGSWPTFFTGTDTLNVDLL